MEAQDIMTKDVVWVRENESVKDVATKMDESDVGSIIVLDNNSKSVKGIITDRDIVIRGVRSNNDINSLKAADVMTTDVVTATKKNNVDDIIDLMSNNQIKRVPIVDNNQLVGIISLGDLSQSYMLEDEAGDVLNDITKESEYTRMH